jgi:hypothetical protein
MTIPFITFVIVGAVFLIMILIIKGLHHRNRKIISKMRDDDIVTDEKPVEIHIDIKVSGPSFATPEELDLRNAIEDAIEQANIGEVVDVGTGMGEMNIAVEVHDPQEAFAEIKSIIEQFGLCDRTKITFHPALQ